MSRFFHTSSSSSLGSSDSEDDIDHPASAQDSRVVLGDRTLQDDTGSGETPEMPLQHAVDRRSNHRDLLLQALLEDRCLRQARDQLGEGAAVDLVHSHAQRQYQTLSRRLAPYGLVEPGLETATFSSHRQAIRDGLDALSGAPRGSQLASTDIALRHNGNAGRVMLEFDALQLSHLDIELPQLRQMPSTTFVDALLSTPGSLVTSPATFFSSSRYQREFEEVCMLGKGGYGVVYQCKHRFDGLSYAVKKIPLSTSRLQKIREQGQAAVDRLLLELTTLARLEHPNIVRYFGGWVEYAAVGRQRPNLGDNDATSGASEPTGSASAVSRVAEVANADFITFETSASCGAVSTTETDSVEDDAQQRSTGETQSTISDEDIESITRSAASEDRSTLSNFTQDDLPTLALHIQMGLYPFSLADYISRVSTISSGHKHCFHMEASLRILSAVVDGVVYLHSQAVVHRDLKPANIFLAHHKHKQEWCRQCSVSSDGMKVCIGDFGLVAALARQHGDDMTIPVGTELYRPHDTVDRFRLETLDWYALGIMAFELLWPFSTRMERYETLTALKSGLYPHDFEQHFDGRLMEATGMIEYLLRQSHAVNPEELQAMLGSMLAKCHDSKQHCCIAEA